MSLSFVFPGQGSQSVGMLSELAASTETVQATFAEASDALDFDLWGLVQSGPESDLNKTRNTQPAMLAAGVAVWRVWRDRDGPVPAAMAGHSLGEYTALVCANALEFKSAVRLVQLRGTLMQEAVPEGEGAMAAILGLDDAAVAEACAEASGGEVVEPVNFNAPGQVVIAGSRAAVERAVEAAKTRGARRAMSLPVSVPSHCSLMQPAAEKLAVALVDVDVKTPDIPVVHNVDAGTRSEPDEIREALVMQLASPVRWVDSIRAMAAAGVTGVVECGPGKILAGLNRRIERRMPVHAVFDGESLDKTLGELADQGD